MSAANGDNVDLLVGQACEACQGQGVYECEISGLPRVCYECNGTGVVDAEEWLEDEPFDGIVPLPNKAL